MKPVMRARWILAASRTAAHIYQQSAPGRRLKLIRSIEHPEGRLRNRQLGRDRPGRAFERVGLGRHSMGTDQNPADQVALQFARHLAALLYEGRVQNRFQHLVLAAEPRFLGDLKDALDHATAARLIACIDKDLFQIEEIREIPELLSQSLPA